MTDPKKRGLAGLLNMRYVPPVFITLILLTGHFTFGILEGFGPIILAIAGSIVAEMVLARVILGKWKNLASAYITGISVGILVRSTFIWPFLLTSVISIMSKYVLRYKERHIWNPSNFGVSWMLMFAPFSVAGLSVQWGNNMLPMLVIWMLGLVIVWRVKRLHITLTYVTELHYFFMAQKHDLRSRLYGRTGATYGSYVPAFYFFYDNRPGNHGKKQKGPDAGCLSDSPD